MKREDYPTNIFLRPRFVCSKCGDMYLFESSLEETEDKTLVCKKCLSETFSIGKEKKYEKP